MIFEQESLFEILNLLEKQLNKDKDGSVKFTVLDPDVSFEFSGTPVLYNGINYIYRPYKAWTDLAEVLKCRMMTPEKTGCGLITVSYKRLDHENSWHKNSGIDIREKYGRNSEFFRIMKLEEPYFLNDYIRAVKNIRLFPGMNILDLGIHRGDEFQMIKRMRKDISDRINFTGIDHCASALSYAKEIFPDKNYRFIESDIKDIDKLELNKQDLIISIGTLQSPDIKGKEIFRYIIQKLINKNAGVILGFPNSRYIDREVIYGAKTKNYREQNMNLLIKDMAFYKKYLQQHGFKVITFGKYYIFLSAFR